MISTCVNIEDPAFDQFLTEAAIHEFRTHMLAANVLQLLGIFQGMTVSYLVFTYILL